MRTVAHNTLFLTGASLIQKALSFIYFTILARTFSSSEIGAYSYALAFTTLFAVIVDGGLTPVLIRHVSTYPNDVAALLRKILISKSALFLAALAAMVLTVSVNTAAQSVAPLIAVAALVMIVDSLNLSVYGVLRGCQNLVYESVGMIVAQTVSLASVIGVVMFELPILFAICGLGMGSVMSSMISWVGLKRVAIAAHASSRAPIVVDNALLAREAFPFALAGVCARGYSYLDLLLIGSFMNFAAAGTYSIANKLTFVFQFIPLALTAALYPAFSKEVASNHAAVRSLWLSAQRYLLCALGFIVLILISLRVEILSFFGTEHMSATATLSILAVSLIFAFMSYPVGSLLNASGLQRLQTGAMAAAFALNATTNIVLIPLLGSVGAASSALAGNFFLFFIGAWFAQRRVCSLPWINAAHSAIIFLVSACVGGVAIFVSRAYFFEFASLAPQRGAFEQLLAIGTLSIVGALAYAAAVFLLRGIHVSEIRSFVTRLRS
ncbi:MAG: hypothetical protein A3C15_03610 [Candidatus Magasanikbacteria bacterium RIFCSPHIGHO2_02_FULL_50_9b]|uniref:Uncharacterized protein n=1 Tax=Candidatus Magasanikbacteria bacterium RIFCSPHIGHO2_02_FULL_50_9b TaxID=1798682 RepID=A0A1F6M952_9BACT|nr:MAG: hypothetical protein A3C15_03610 [Candidatus Magasanikbacteria bacterium RIFCSPHIGHO2_02_FULL_50_9b]